MYLQGKIALITGGSRGIGRETALLFSALGAQLIIVSQSEGGKDIAQEIQDKGKQALAIQADISNQSDVHRIFTESLEVFPHVDILVNNAGITKDALSMRMSENDWDTVLRVNLKGAFLCSKEAMRIMVRRRSGVIVNIASIVGLTGNIGQANYAASKAGLIGMTKSMALELASRQIRVNAVAPGFIDTDMTQQIPDEMLSKIKERIPLQRFGKAEDVASLVAFLSSDRATYITGQTFIVDGGLSL